MLLTALSLFAATGSTATPVSAPIANIQYDITFTRETAARNTLGVTMRFDVAGSGDIILSLPSWSPGSYEVVNFARFVSAFEAMQGDTELRWDKVDYDTWRIRPAGRQPVTVSFDAYADSEDVGMAWSAPDFAFFNGTAVFPYPEGRGFDFGATVRVHTETGWQVATGMHGGPAAAGFREGNYHDLVDMPMFVGKFDYDSMTVDGLKVRLATYPAGTLAGSQRADFWAAYRRLFKPQSAVFGETPYDSYTTLMAFTGKGGGSALEHQSSHLGIYDPEGIGQDWVTSITSHEMFHAYNVKRMRPADITPYRYDVPQPTPWLWVSEGITDYYADLVMARAGLTDSTGFAAAVGKNMADVAQLPPVALEDASLSTWIRPTDGTMYVYYPKGSLAGFALDIMIRDASDNRKSLDDAMREVYQATYKKGKGFGATEWWGAVSRAAGGRKFDDFNVRYIDGREPYPWDSILPLAGMRRFVDSISVPRLGIQFSGDSSGMHAVAVAPDGVAARAGVQAGDILLEIGGIPVNGEASFAQFRTEFANRAGEDLPMKVRRDGQEVLLTGKVELRVVMQERIGFDPSAGEKALRIRRGILTGTTGR